MIGFHADFSIRPEARSTNFIHATSLAAQTQDVLRDRMN
jgi:hypothetical protein